MSPEGTSFETIEEFLDSLPEAPCSSKLGEPFCSLCERVNRKVARACKHSRIYSGEEIAPSPPGEAEERGEGDEAAEELRLRKIIKEKGLPEIEIVPPGGEVLEMKVEEGEVVFKKAGEAEIQFAKLKRRAQEELMEVQRLLGNMKELGYGLENLKEEIKKMAEDFRGREYERVIERAEKLRKGVLEEENMKVLKESLESLVKSLSKEGRAGRAGEFLKDAVENYDRRDYPAFIESSVRIMKEIERALGSKVVIGIPLEIKEEAPKPVKKVVKKIIEVEQKPPEVASEVSPSTEVATEETKLEEKKTLPGGEKSGASTPRRKKKATKKVIKKAPRAKDRISEIVAETYGIVEAKRGEGRDVSQILELLAMVDQKRKEGEEEFAMKLAAQSLEMARKL
ncbi:MAG: hypothetical protein DRN35_00435 [Thermoplasmata archaeon]|nr:MAG: hypothetical protein DRN35_00435 [Thermoplasmata archaeon]